MLGARYPTLAVDVMQGILGARYESLAVDMQQQFVRCTLSDTSSRSSAPVC